MCPSSSLQSGYRRPPTNPTPSRTSDSESWNSFQFGTLHAICPTTVLNFRRTENRRSITGIIARDRSRKKEDTLPLPRRPSLFRLINGRNLPSSFPPDPSKAEKSALLLRSGKRRGRGRRGGRRRSLHISHTFLWSHL